MGDVLINVPEDKGTSCDNGHHGHLSILHIATLILFGIAVMPQHMGELPYTIPVMDEKSGEIRQVGSVWSIQTLLHSLYNSRAWS